MGARNYIILSLLGVMLWGCSSPEGQGDAGTDADLASDGDADVEGDGDVPVDGDTAADGDADTPLDGDVPSDGGPGPSTARPRLIVTTDIGGDPDDQQSMVRLLLYANELDIEGLVASASGTPGELGEAVVRPDLIREHIEAYGEVRDALATHAAGYPTAEQLLDRVRAGNPNRGRDFIGEGHDTEGSRWIIDVVDVDDPRPVDIAIWGGQTDLAQALHRVQTDRSAEEYRAFVSRIRVHDIADQDEIFDWMWGQFPGLWYVLDKAQSGGRCASVFRGMFLGGDLSLVTREWLEEHVVEGHGALGALYPTDGLWTCGNGIDALKEGDTPSWFYFLRHGINDPAHPEWGGWGGRFELEGGVYRDAMDTAGGETSRIATVFRFRPAFQNDFQARLDWCLRSAAEANHPPTAVLEGDRTREVVVISAEAGAELTLSAAGSADPDGDELHFHHWVYDEAGSYEGDVTLAGADGRDVVVTVPVDGAGHSIHVVLEVTDSGDPPLTTSRRAVLDVR